MNAIQELRGEVRQLLNDTLVFAAANRNDFEVADLAAAKAAIYREVLELIAKVDNQMRSLTAGIAILTPALLYAILPSVTITYESTILFTLISLLSLSVLAGLVALSKEGK